MKIRFVWFLCLSAAMLTRAVYGQELTAVDFKSDRPTPRMADGHPDFSGYWKGTRDTRPVGNIGKDLPGFKLPLTQLFERLAREVADLRLRGPVDLERADPTVRVDGDGARTGRAAGGRRGGEDEDGQPLHNLSMGAIIGLCA